VLCLRDVVLTAIFSKTYFNDAIKTFQYLCFLRADFMLPLLIDKIYSCFESSSLVEPLRYTPLLACLTSVPRELTSFNSNYHSQKHAIQLMISVLPGIDINELNKFILTFQFLTNMLEHIVVCDCSQAVNIRSDLTEYEKELCLLTLSFDDFVTELLHR
jgi:proteasome activator subunit 4